MPRFFTPIARCFLFSLIAYVSISVSPSEASSPCVPYFSARKQLENKNMGIRVDNLPDLPPAFSSGCTYASLGANTFSMYVLSRGAELNSTDGYLLDTGVPKVLGMNNITSDRRVLTIFTICRSNGTYKYCLDKPKNRAYQDYRDDELVTCYQSLCLKATGISSDEQLQIMNSLSSRKK